MMASLTLKWVVKMHVLVCGGRDFQNKDFLEGTLDRLNNFVKINEIIQGGAPGADKLAREWARERNIKINTFYAQWIKYGLAAGPIRNQQMLDEGKPNLVIAFPGGKGTANMIELAKKAGVRWVQIYPDRFKEQIRRALENVEENSKG